MQKQKKARSTSTLALCSTIRRSVRANFATGLLVLAPFGAVLGILVWFWNGVVALTDLIPSTLHPIQLFQLEHPLAITAVEFVFNLAILLLSITLVILIGFFSRRYVGARILHTLSRFVARVPILNAVYSTLEQLLKTFSGGQTKNFRKVVLIEYPRKGIETLAFVTHESSSEHSNAAVANDRDKVHLFVPTTPNPTSGFYLIVSKDQVKETNMSVENALKEIISMGLVRAQR